MSAISFPPSPINGQIYANAGQVWVFNSSVPAWEALPIQAHSSQHASGGPDDLGLGGASLLEVGTAPGTVAAGDHLHAQPQGTAILSTGETGGVKFLRENGDGTASWQPATGGGGSNSTITLSGQSLTGSQGAAVVDLSTTWNTSGNPAMIYGRVTNTASGSDSNLIDLGTTAGGSLFRVTKSGRAIARGGVLFGDPDTTASGMIFGANNVFNYGLETYGDFAFQAGLSLPHGEGGLGNVTAARLAGDGANGIAQIRGTNPQIHRLYNTFTTRGAGTTNLEALETRSQTSGNFIIQSLKGSAGGAARDIEFRHGATDANRVITNGALIATVSATGFIADAGLKLGVKTVGTLPTAAINTYLEFVVTDSFAPVIGATVAAGGTAKAKVISNGTSWIVTSTL